jgi:hypothetical protein
MLGRLYLLTLGSDTVADVDQVGGHGFLSDMPLDMSELIGLRMDLADVGQTLSQATDDLAHTLGASQVEEHRQLLIQVAVDVAEAGRTAAKAWAGVRDLVRTLDAYSETLAAQERAAEAERDGPSPF